MKQGKKLSSKAAGILTAVAMIASMAGGCAKSEESKESNSSGSSVEASVSDSAEDKETEITSESADAASEDDAQAENDISDTQVWVSETTQDATEEESTDAASDEEPTQVVSEEPATVSVPTIEGHGRVLFTQEYNNYAWGRQSEIMAILEDGSFYLIKNEFREVSGKIDEGYLLILLANLEDLGNEETLLKLEDDYLSKLVTLADAIDPDAEVTCKHVQYDSGQTAVYYWTEDGQRIRCLEYGDTEYSIDDPDAELFKEMWKEIYTHLESIS